MTIILSIKDLNMRYYIYSKQHHDHLLYNSNNHHLNQAQKSPTSWKECPNPQTQRQPFFSPYLQSTQKNNRLSRIDYNFVVSSNIIIIVGLCCQMGYSIVGVGCWPGMPRTQYRQKDFAGPSSNSVADSEAVDRQVGMDQTGWLAAEPPLPFELLEEERHCLRKQTGPPLQTGLGQALHIRAAGRLYMPRHHTNCSEWECPIHQPAHSFFFPYKNSEIILDYNINKIDRLPLGAIWACQAWHVHLPLLYEVWAKLDH